MKQRGSIALLIPTALTLVTVIGIAIGGIIAQPSPLTETDWLTLVSLLGLTTVLGWYLHRRIIRPIIALHRGAHRLGNIDSPEIPPEIRTDASAELNQLAQTIVSTASTLAQQRATLNSTRADLNQCMQELSCLYEVYQLIGLSDQYSESELLELIAQRLPAAMPYPSDCESSLQITARPTAPITQQLTISADARISDDVYLSGTIRYHTKQAESHPFETDAQRLLDAVIERTADAISRRRTRAALNDNLTKLSAILEQAPYAIELVDAQSMQLVEANTASCELLGYAPGERLGQRVHEIQAEMDDTQLEQIRQSILATGQAQFITKHRHKDGHLIDAEVRVRPLELQGIRYLLGIWRDVTEQIAAEERLQKMFLAVEQSPNAIIVTDLTPSIEYVNQAFVDLSGYTREQVLGKNPSLLKSGKTPLQTYQEMWRTLQQGRKWHGEFINRTASGKEVIERSSISPLQQSDGRITHYVAVKEEIAEQIKVQRQLANSHLHLEKTVNERTAELREATQSLRSVNAEQQAILDTASSGIVLIKDRTLIRCNRHLHQMFGWPQGDMIGRKTAIWYADQQADAIGAEPYPAIWSGLTHQREQQLMRRDGSLFWARLAGTAVDVNDPSKGSVWVIDDVSAEHAAKQQMAEAARLAESAAQAKADFLANMSHEIRTPMNSIIGMSHLALQNATDEQQQHRLEKIQYSARHLLNLINDILDLSKMDAGKLEMEETDFELDQLLANVADMIHDKAEDKGISLVILRDPAVPRKLIGDHFRISQILINFLSNAVKFTEQGDITLQARIDQRKGSSILLRIEVVDTGVGISDEHISKLFQQFSQADNSITRKYGGTGLGLAISKQLAELMHGKVGVSSVLGMGSNFWLQIPLQIAHESSTEMPGSDPTSLPKRLLLIEADGDARIAMQSMLQSMHFQPELYANAEQTLQAMQQHATPPFDFALIDWRLPDMDGIQLIQKLGQMFGDQLPPIAMTTLHDQHELSLLASEIGIEHILLKPATPSSLLDTITRLVYNPSDHQASPVIDAKSGHKSDLHSIRGAKILLVDDNEINREVGTELLKQAGIMVETAENGAIAVQKMSQHDWAHTIDLILMDMQMPVMDGPTAAAAILELPACQDIPIIALTANVMPSDIERCLAAGMKDHLGKPIEPNLLREKLQYWIPPKYSASSSPENTAARTTEYYRDCDLKPIEGLDSDTGLQLQQGKKALYLRVLRQFVDAQTRYRDAMIDAIARDDGEAATLLTHTLKGSAAQIGAKQIQHQATELEDLLKQQPLQQAKPLLKALNNSLGRLLEQLEQQLPNDHPPATEGELQDRDQERLKTVLNTIYNHLEMDDTGVSTILRSNRSLLRRAFGDRINVLQTRVDLFDFEAALTYTQKLIDEID